MADYARSLVDAMLGLEDAPEITILAPELPGPPSNSGNTYGDRVTLLRTWRPNSLRSLLKLRRWLRRKRFDVVHLQYSGYPKFGGLIGEPLAIVFLGLNRVSRTAVTLHTIWTRSLMEEKLAERFGLRGILAAAISGMVRLMTRAGLTLFDQVVVLGNSERNLASHAVETEFGVDARRVSNWVHPCPVPFERPSAARVREGATPDVELAIVSPGFIARRKGLDDLVEAAELLRGQVRFRLTIAGQVPDPREERFLVILRESIRSRNLDSLVAIDTRIGSPRDLELLASASDLIVLPHRTRSGPSGILCRLAPLGVPIVATSDPIFLPPDSPSPFLLCPPGDPAALAATILAALTAPRPTNPPFRRMAEWAAEHSYEKHAQLQLQSYARLRGES